jgi:hypothetical protein
MGGDLRGIRASNTPRTSKNFGSANAWNNSDWEDETVSVLGLLKKLGIVRYGAKAAVYHNGSERPLEFLMDDVFNAETDLVNGKSKGSRAAAKKGSSKYMEPSFLSDD